LLTQRREECKQIGDHTGDWYKFLPHLGFICFPVDLINLQVQKPAFADLLDSQFTKDWREIHPDFSSQTFDTWARVFFYPQARVGHACAFLFISFRAHTPNAPLSTQEVVHLTQNLHCKLLDVGKLIPLVKMIMCKL
jgi:hypothetical protein